MGQKTIDLEPTWSSILQGVISGHIKPEHAGLEKPCQIADFIRRAQKHLGPGGSVTFTFEEDGNLTKTERGGK